MLTNNIPNKSKKDTTILSMRGVINSIKSIVSENIYIHPYIHIYVDNTYKCAYAYLSLFSNIARKHYY